MNTALDLIDRIRWIDRTPLRRHVEPYRRRIFGDGFDARDDNGRPQHNLILTARAKKNWKSADLVFASKHALLTDSPGGSQCYLLANDEDQARDNLTLAKKLIAANPALQKALRVKQNLIERRDGRGFLQILPAGDVVGTHGKTYRFCGFDEIHGYRNWDVLEAMQLDPTRPDAQMWITSYASIYHKPGVPLFDLCAMGRAGLDPRMFFSWYAADYTTDPDFTDATPEERANPSMKSWADPNYLEQQRRRLPSHKFRRLHLNLPGLPAGSAFSVEKVLDAVARGVPGRLPEPGVQYIAFVDMSGGSNDDAVLAIGYVDADDRAVVARMVNQGQPPPFDPHQAVARFATVLREYRICALVGDNYAGNTFKAAFEKEGFRYTVSPQSKSKLYEAFEPALNARRVVLLDVPEVEQQLLGLVWRGGKIDKPNGEHDDWANAACGCVHELLKSAQTGRCVWCGKLVPDECPGAHGGGDAEPTLSERHGGQEVDRPILVGLRHGRVYFPGD